MTTYANRKALMIFQKVDGPILQAEKLSGRGILLYSVWINDWRDEYAQICGNLGGAGQSSGTYTSYVYKINNTQFTLPIKGYDVVTGLEKTSKDKNMPAFLKAIKADFRRRQDESASDISR